MLSGTQINSAIREEIVYHKLNNPISKEVFYESLKLKLILSLSITFIFGILLRYISVPIFTANLLWVLILLVLMNIWGLIISFLESIHRLFWEAVLYFVEYALTVGAIILFYTQGNLDIKHILWAFILGYSVSLVFGIIVSLRLFKHFPDVKFFRSRSNLRKKLLHRTFILSISGVLLIFLSRIDTLMVSYLLNPYELGLYSVAGDLAKNAAIISVPIMLGVLPLFFEGNQKRFILKNMIIISVINLGIALGIFLVGRIFIVRIYGLSLLPAVAVLKALAFYPLFASLQSFMQEIMILKGKIKQIYLFGFIAVLLDIVLNYLLILKYGIVGAGIATTCAYGFWFLLSFLYNLWIMQKNYQEVAPVSLS
jgi:O-antigen/teichoic acid export membrane protein